MVRFACPNCKSTLTAKAGLVGQKRNCPKCKHPVRVPALDSGVDYPRAETIPLDEATPDEHVHGAMEDHLPEAIAPRKFQQPNRYWILDKSRVFAMWNSDGLGWMVKTSTGLIPATRDPTQLPAHGAFTMVIVLMKSTDQGLRLAGITTYKIAGRWAIPSLAKGEKTILTHLRGPGSLTVEQKMLVWNQIRSEFMPAVWEEATNVREFIFNNDYWSSGTE